MSQEKNLIDAGKRLAKDLREIRTNRKVDVDLLLNTTRLPRDIFKRFDENALVDHPAFNRVYLRSIVTSYASVLKIDVDDARDALELVLQGTYEHQLLDKYLPNSRTVRQETSVDTNRGDDGKTGTADGKKKPAAMEAESQTVTDESGAVSSPENEVAEVSEPRGKESMFAADRSNPTSLSGTVYDLAPVEKSVKTWQIVVVVAILATLLWVILSGLWSAETLEESGVQDPQGRTETAQEISIFPEPPPEFIVLPDSMEFQIIAAFGDVDPIRVTRDLWARRPYWIEEGDTLTLRAAQSILFESDIESARIELHGFALSDSLIDVTGRIELNRLRAQRWLDSLIVIRHRRR